MAGLESSRLIKLLHVRMAVILASRIRRKILAGFKSSIQIEGALLGRK